MNGRLATLSALLVGCGGLASTESGATSPVASEDDSSCAATDGAVEAAWDGTTPTFSEPCDGEDTKLAYIGGGTAFELCVRDESGLTLVLGEVAPGQEEWGQVYLEAGGSRTPWVAQSGPGFSMTLTAVGAPGHYVEGTFTGLLRSIDPSNGAGAGPAKSLSGSFKVCRAPDEPAPK